jgi:NADH-quinone oxidoreductase subunit G
MTRVIENMVVTTETPDLQQMRKAILEYTLIHHPLDCPICDKAGECQLQDQYMKYSGADSRFREQKIAKGKLYKFSERIIYDAERCITCTRCVRFTQDISKSNKLGVIKRGDRSYVSLAPGDTFDDPYSDCVTDICPVGALTSRQFRFKERVWNLQKTDSICAGCSRGCNISVQHKNHKIYRIVPRFNRDVNQFWMCDFGRDYTRLHNPETRIAGSQIAGKNVKYDLFLSSVAETLKKAGSKTGLILSSHATNEELAEARKLCDRLKITDIYKKSDRVWQKDSLELEKDDFLIFPDKTPNLNGITHYFPAAKEIGQFKSDGLECVFVWGTGAPAEKLTGLKVIQLSTIIDKVSPQAHWLIAGRLPVE